MHAITLNHSYTRRILPPTSCHEHAPYPATAAAGAAGAAGAAATATAGGLLTQRAVQTTSGKLCAAPSTLPSRHKGGRGTCVGDCVAVAGGRQVENPIGALSVTLALCHSVSLSLCRQAGRPADRQAGSTAGRQAGRKENRLTAKDRQTHTYTHTHTHARADTHTQTDTHAVAKRHRRCRTERKVMCTRNRKSERGQEEEWPNEKAIDRTTVDNHGDRKADRQTDRQAHQQTGRKIDRPAERQAGKQAGKQAGRQAGMRAGGRAGGQAGRHAGRQGGVRMCVRACVRVLVCERAVFLASCLPVACGCVCLSACLHVSLAACLPSALLLRDGEDVGDAQMEDGETNEERREGGRNINVFACMGAMTAYRPSASVLSLFVSLLACLLFGRSVLLASCLSASLPVSECVCVCVWVGGCLSVGLPACLPHTYRSAATAATAAGVAGLRESGQSKKKTRSGRRVATSKRGRQTDDHVERQAKSLSVLSACLCLSLFLTDTTGLQATGCKNKNAVREGETHKHKHTI
jgi:hypothetical protein